jgi:hypothetical protein
MIKKRSTKIFILVGIGLVAAVSAVAGGGYSYVNCQLRKVKYIDLLKNEKDLQNGYHS